MRRLFAVAAVAVLCAACQTGSATPSESERAAVADTVKAVINSVFDAASRLDAQGFVKRYAQDSVIIVDNGVSYSPTAFVPTADSFYKAMSTLQTKPTEFHTTVLAADAAATTVPFTWSATTKSGKALSGDGIWTAVLRKQNGTWVIISSHESEKSIADVMAALAPTAPAPPKKK